MKFGIGIPTCREGLNHPAPFAGPDEIVKLAQMAERLGYYAVWGNDHMVPPPDALNRYPKPPNFYEALISLSYVSRHTERIKLGTGIIVMPLRDPVLLAKQVATLDQFSGGRFMLGVGLGSLRYEFEALYPNRKGVRRGDVLNEGLEALKLLLTQEVASFRGHYYEFQDICITPKPLQNPLPVYISGNNKEVPKRVARWCTGWLIGSITGDAIRERWNMLIPALEEVRRDPSDVDMGAITTLSIGRTHEEAVARHKAAAIPRTRSGSVAKAATGDQGYNFLLGSPSELIEQISEMEEAGLTQCIAQNVAVNTFEEMEEMVQMFGEEVIPAFK